MCISRQASCKSCWPLPLRDACRSIVVVRLAVVCLQLLPAWHAGLLVCLLRLLGMLRVLLSGLGRLLVPVCARIVRGRARSSSMLLAGSAVVTV